MQADDPKGFVGNCVLDHSGVPPVLRVKLAVLMGFGVLYFSLWALYSRACVYRRIGRHAPLNCWIVQGNFAGELLSTSGASASLTSTLVPGCRYPDCRRSLPPRMTAYCSFVRCMGPTARWGPLSGGMPCGGLIRQLISLKI